MGFCALHQLQLATEPASVDALAREERALAVAASCLAQRDILDLQRGAFVRLALGRFSCFLSVLQDSMPGKHCKKS